MKKRVPFGAFVVVAFVLGCAVLVVAVPAEAQTHVVPPSKVKVLPAPAPDKIVSKAILNLDATDSCGEDPAWAYICEAGAHHGWFAFDVSGIPPGTPLASITFTAFLTNETDAPVERSIWYAADDSWVGGTCPDAAPADVLVGTLTHTNLAAAWETFDINMAAHDFTGDLADGIITFMVTGPTSGAHECGRIDLIASGNVPYVTVDAALAGVDVPTAGIFGLLLLVVLLSTAGFILLRR